MEEKRLRAWLVKHPAFERYLLPVGAVLCAILWGSAFPSIKIAYQHIDGGDFGVRVAFAGMRFTLAGLALLLIFGRRGQDWRKAPKGLIISIMLCQVVIQYVLFYWGLALISGMLSAIIQATGSFWWIFLAPLVGQASWPTARQLTVLILGFLGVAICVYQGGAESADLPLGLLVTLLATVSGAGAMLLIRPASQHVPVPFISGVSLFIGGLILLAMSPGDVITVLDDAPIELILLTIYLAFVSAVAFSLWYSLIILYDFTRLSGYRFIIPVFGVIESALFIQSESLSLTIVIGGLLVAASVFLLEREKRRKSPGPAWH